MFGNSFEKSHIEGDGMKEFCQSDGSVAGPWETMPLRRVATAEIKVDPRNGE
jgi:hypothetical protein